MVIDDVYHWHDLPVMQLQVFSKQYFAFLCSRSGRCPQPCLPGPQQDRSRQPSEHWGARCSHCPLQTGVKPGSGHTLGASAGGRRRVNQHHSLDSSESITDPRERGLAAAKLEKAESFTPISAACRTCPLRWLPNSCCQDWCLTAPVCRIYLQEARQSWNVPRSWGARTCAQLLAPEEPAPIPITANKITAGIANRVQS